MKNKISNFEFGTINYFVTKAFILGITFNCLVASMKQDSWLIPLISICISIIFILFVNYIMNYKPELNLSEKIIGLFKRKVGITILILSSLFAFFMCSLNYLNLNNFIHSQFLNKTPILAISVLFAVALFYVLSKGINVLFRTSTILFYIEVFIIILTIIGLIPTIEIDNIKPIFQFKALDCVKALTCFYAYNISPIFILTIIPKNKIKNPHLKTSLIISFIFSAFIAFIILFDTISTFGYKLTVLYEYPEFHVLKHISLIGLSTRIESILIIQWLFDLFMCSLFILYFLSINIKNIINSKNTNIINFLICFSLVICTSILSRYNIFLNNITLNILPVPTAIFTILITIIIFIKIKISK